MTALVLRGDAKRLPLPDASVDLIATSPPYFALRSYTDGGAHYAGQIGSEPTPAAYIAALVECTREWVRVLKPSGSIFVNLGDKYAERGGPERDAGVDGGQVNHRAARPRRKSERETGIRQKSLMLLPERYRIACVDQLGLIARAVLVWSKPNGLPESVTDRVRRSHEDWVHLVKQPRYFAAVDEIREAHRPASLSRARYGVENTHGPLRSRYDRGGEAYRVDREVNPLGKSPGSVWEVATEPLKVPERLGVDHFAAFPSEWPRRLILGWSPSGVCTACGEGRRPVVDNACTPYTDHPGTGESSGPAYGRTMMAEGTYQHSAEPYGYRLGTRPKTGPWRECHFDRWTPAPTRPGVVLDPFGGTGTTAHVAAALGRVGISVDLSADYCRLAAAPELFHQRRRKVLGLDKPPAVVVPEGQLTFEEMGA